MKERTEERKKSNNTQVYREIEKESSGKNHQTNEERKRARKTGLFLKLFSFIS